MHISYPALSSSWEVTDLGAGKFCAWQVKVLCPTPLLTWTVGLLGKGPSLTMRMLPGIIRTMRLLFFIALRYMLLMHNVYSLCRLRAPCLQTNVLYCVTGPNFCFYIDKCHLGRSMPLHSCQDRSQAWLVINIAQALDLLLPKTIRDWFILLCCPAFVP